MLKHLNHVKCQSTMKIHYVFNLRIIGHMQLQMKSYKGSVIFYQGGAPENWGGSGTLSKIKRRDQKIFQIKKGGITYIF